MIPITQEVIDQFRYEDGLLFWVDPKGARCKGPVGSTKSAYLHVQYKSRKYKVHRIVWAMHHGDTQLEIDHINQCKHDNRIENLRAVDHKTNMSNQPAFRKGGVTWHYYGWRAMLRGKHLLYTPDLFEAWCARKSAENNYGNS